ncbi:MAG TPA: phosphoribosylamine--glycine ligase [Vicinamibacterales bacterium]|nr:phosphoribosylamine--glycine ligase [Vicinamibacterales bacterium]
MRILVIGSGAREHALAWKLSAGASPADLFCVPGNPGIARHARLLAADVADPASLLDLVSRERIDLTVVGPELPLERGVTDAFRAAGRAIVGPSRAAAQLETSKVFAKAFMARHGVPTARHRACERPDDALAVLRRGEFGYPIVIKADGLAAGKGVVVAPDSATAEEAIRAAMIDRRFGEAGARVVIEEFLRGTEASFFVLCDGRGALPLTSAQDHKRAFDDDQGPNTGGMGAFAPSPLVTPDVERRIMREIVDPVLTGLQSEGEEYSGFLYVGLMLTADGPRVVEFNVRLGDPEAQVVLPMIDADLLPLLQASASGELDRVRVRFSTAPHVGVVLASKGYPGAVENGKTITGIELAERLDHVMVFHAGTAERDGRLVTNGGRVLTVVGRGGAYAEAIRRAYEGVSRIAFEGMHYRRDIGRTALGHPSLGSPVGDPGRRGDVWTS